MKKNQNGFSAVEVVLVLLIGVLIVVVGFMAYKNTHKTNVASTNSASVLINNTREVQFKELGVQFNSPTSLKNLTYTVQKLPDGNGSTVDVLYLADSQLNTLLNECSAAIGQPSSTDAPTFASISRTDGQYNKTSEMGESQLLKQFSTFHIMVGFPNGAICGSSDQTLNDSWSSALKKDQTDFVNSFKTTAEEIK